MEKYQQLFKKIFELFDKYGQNLIVSCEAKDQTDIKCELQNGTFTENDTIFLEKIKHMLGENYIDKLKKIKISYEKYKETGDGHIKCSMSNGETFIFYFEEMINNTLSAGRQKIKSKSPKISTKKSPKQSQTSTKKSPISPSKTDKLKSFGKSLISTGRQLGIDIPEPSQILSTVAEKGKQLLNTEVINSIKKISTSGEKLFNEFMNIENVFGEKFDIIGEKFDKLEGQNQLVITHLEELIQTGENINKNISTSTDKLIEFLDRFNKQQEK